MHFQVVSFLRIADTNIQQHNSCLYFPIMQAPHTKFSCLHNSALSLILFSQICHFFNLSITITGPLSLGDVESEPRHFPCEHLLSCCPSNDYQFQLILYPKCFPPLYKNVFLLYIYNSLPYLEGLLSRNTICLVLFLHFSMFIIF